MREILLLFLLIFLPIAHGGVETWSVTVMHEVSIIIFALWVYYSLKNNALKINRTPLDIPLALFLGFLIFSLTFSLYPYASRIQLYRVVNYIAIFYLLINTLGDEERLVKFSGYLSMLGAIYGIAGLIFITGNFIGFKIFSSNNFLSFTFRNHNHFAGYMNMITWLCIGMALYYSSRKRLVFIALGIGSTSAVLLSLSRGGIIGFLGGILFFSLMNVLARNRRAIFLITSMIVIVIAIMILTGSFDVVFERMTTLKQPEITSGERLRMWAGVLDMIKDNPLIGTGIGTFAYAYPVYQTVGGYTINHAHNEYLETMSETGLIGGALLFLCIIILFGYVIRHSTFQSGRNLSGISIGALSACFSLLTHEFFDFNLYIPSNALLFTVCGAIAITSASIDDKESKEWINTVLSAKGKKLFYLISSVICLISFTLVTLPYLSSIYHKKSKIYQMSGNYKLAHEALKKAIFFDPGNAEFLSSAGDLMVLMAVSQKNNDEINSFLYKSIEYYDKAIKNCPVRSYFYRRKAYNLRILGEFDKAVALLRKAINLEKADSDLYHELAELYLENGRLEEALEEYREYVIKMQGALHLVKVLDRIWKVTRDYYYLNKVVPEDAVMRDAFANYLWKKGIHDAAIKEFAYAYELAPSVERALRHLQYLINTKRYREGYNFCKKYLRDFKDNIQLYKKLLWFSKRIGKLNEALLICEKLADLDSRNRLSYELEIARIYCNQKNWRGAFDTLEEIRYNAPNTPELYFVMAECYRGRKMLVQALKAREKAVLLMPDNPNYLFNLGFDYRVNGLHKKALESWRRCLEINPLHKGCREWVKRYEADGRRGVR
jgi:tetratricopeptide (TPR) repeat protein